MNTLAIPNTDLHASMLCFGTESIGAKSTESEAHALLDTFVTHGGNFIDTARIYSNWFPGELNCSERIIGDWLANRRDRDRLIIATKGGHFDLKDRIPRLSTRELELDLAGSLAKLQTDCIDLYWLHRDDPNRTVAELLETLHTFQQAGKIRHYACSNWHPDRISQAIAYAREKGYTGFVANQMRWSIGSPNMRPSSDPTVFAMDEPTYDLHVQTGLAAVPYSSQAGGFFTKFSDDPNIQSGYATRANRALHHSLQALSQKLNLTIGQLVLAYLWSHPFPVIPIIGCRNVEQLEDSLKALGHRLPDDVVKQLTEKHNLPFVQEL